MPKQKRKVVSKRDYLLYIGRKNGLRLLGVGVLGLAGWLAISRLVIFSKMPLSLFERFSFSLVSAKFMYISVCLKNDFPLKLGIIEMVFYLIVSGSSVFLEVGLATSTGTNHARTIGNYRSHTRNSRLLTTGILHYSLKAGIKGSVGRNIHGIPVSTNANKLQCGHANSVLHAVDKSTISDNCQQ